MSKIAMLDRFLSCSFPPSFCPPLFPPFFEVAQVGYDPKFSLGRIEAYIHPKFYSNESTEYYVTMCQVIC